MHSSLLHAEVASLAEADVATKVDAFNLHQATMDFTIENFQTTLSKYTSMLEEWWCSAWLVGLACGGTCKILTFIGSQKDEYEIKNLPLLHFLHSKFYNIINNTNSFWISTCWVFVQFVSVVTTVWSKPVSCVWIIHNYL